MPLQSTRYVNAGLCDLSLRIEMVRDLLELNTVGSKPINRGYHCVGRRTMHEVRPSGKVRTVRSFDLWMRTIV